ncbi:MULTISPECIES: anti-sigma factor [unclassified Salinibacterium]|uniref:anti-sigma factor n=1 Tax=unclassified Salinibacterium TaxID=2632331 RepID=UPI00143D195A|nr:MULTISPECIES: anti-sigma factor [unclassified Salinibacterium]
MSEHKTPEELAAAYALGALSAEEHAEYEAWLLETPDATADAFAYADVASTLALAAEPVEPSADLRASILAQVAMTPQLPAAPAASASPVASESPEPAESSDPVAAVPTGAEQRAASRWSRGAVFLVAAAAAVLLFVGGGVVGSLIAQGQRNDFAIEQATALAELQAAADAQQAVTEMEGGGQVTLIWSAEQARSAIMVDEMPPAPEGKTYQLWYIREGDPIPDATFEAADEGKTWRVLDGAMTGGDAVGVTLEPEGGSQEPSSDPLVVIGGA